MDMRAGVVKSAKLTLFVEIIRLKAVNSAIWEIRTVSLVQAAVQRVRVVDRDAEMEL